VYGLAAHREGGLGTEAVEDVGHGVAFTRWCQGAASAPTRVPARVRVTGGIWDRLEEFDLSARYREASSALASTSMATLRSSRW